MLENDSQPVINRKKIFRGICLALVPTGFSFVLVSNILGQLKAEFILTNAQVGYIGGAALWGMAISLLTIGPFLEKIGLKRASIGAFVCHLAGVTFLDRKSTRLNSSHVAISYAVFCLKKKQ